MEDVTFPSRTPKRTSIDRNFIAEVTPTVAPKFTPANIKEVEYNTIGNCLLSLISGPCTHLLSNAPLKERRKKKRLHINVG